MTDRERERDLELIAEGHRIAAGKCNGKYTDTPIGILCSALREIERLQAELDDLKGFVRGCSDMLPESPEGSKLLPVQIQHLKEELDVGVRRGALVRAMRQ